MRQLAANEIPSVVSSNYTVQSNDYLIRFDSSGGAFNITLPDPSTRRELKFIDVRPAHYDSQGVTLLPYASEKVAACDEKVLPAQMGTAMSYGLTSDGTDWWADGSTF